MIAAVLAVVLAAIAPDPTAGPQAAAPAAPAAAPAMTYEAAEALARAGRHAEALAAFQALAAKNPDDFDSRVWLGRLLGWAGRRDEALEVYRDVIARSPRYVDARVGLAGVLLALGRVDEAWAAIEDAEALAPGNGDVLAVKGRALRRLGRPAEALTAFDAAYALTPGDTDLEIARERTRRQVAHRAHVSVAQEASADVAEASIVDADMDFRISPGLRAFGRLQWQQRDGLDDTRGGGGVEWQAAKRALVRGAVLLSPASPRVAQTDLFGEVETAAGRAQPSLGVRFLDFADARVWVVGPAISVDVSDDVALALRYYYSHSEFRSTGLTDGTHSGALMWRWQAARRLLLSAAYARGYESFDILSADRLGRFRADTIAGGTRIDLRSLTSLAVGVEHQWRDNDQQLTRVTFDVVQHF